MMLYRIPRTAHICCIVSLLLFTACSEDPSPAEVDDTTDTGVTDTNINEEDSGDDVGAGDTDPDDSGQTDVDEENGDEEPSTLEIPDPSLWVHSDALWIEHAALDGSVAIECDYRDGKGLLLEQPDDLELVVEGYDEVLDDGRFTFAETGVYSVNCVSEARDMEVATEVVVGFEGVNHIYADAMRRVGSLEALWLEFFAIVDEEEPDLDDLDAVLLELESAAEGLSDGLDGEPLLVDHPAGWPDISAVEGAGFEAGADDDDWSALLIELIDEHEIYRQALGELTLEMSDAELDTLAAPLAEIHQLRADMAEFSPSEHAVWSHQEELAQLFEETAISAEFQVEVFAGLATEEPISMVNASLVGQLGVAAVKIGWSRFGFSPMGMYKDLLKDAGRAIAVSAINMTIAGVFNELISPLSQAPEITSIHGSAAGFTCAGVPFTAYGTFQSPAERNRFYFIPPDSIYPIFEMIDLVSQLGDLAGKLDDLVANLDIVSEAMFYNELEKTISAIMGFSTPEAFILEYVPESGDGEFLQFAAPSAGINSSMFPAAGVFFPMDERYGFGYAHEVNVLADSCG